MSLPVEHEKVDQRDLALAWEFAAMLLSFFNNAAASDAFASSVISIDVAWCAFPSSLSSSSKPSSPQLAQGSHQCQQIGLKLSWSRHQMLTGQLVRMLQSQSCEEDFLKYFQSTLGIA